MENKLNNILSNQQKQLLGHENKKEEIVQLVGFLIGDEEYAIPILSIQEIIKPIEFTRIPSVPTYVLGVFNLRGTVLPLIDLRQKFKMTNKKQTEETRFIVIKGEKTTAGFVIDKLTEAIRIPSNKIGPPPDNIQTDKGLVQGIGMRDDSIVTILKIEALLKKDF